MQAHCTDEPILPAAKQTDTQDKPTLRQDMFVYLTSSF